MSTKKEFAKGVAFVAAAKYSGIIIGLVITSILARLLTPKDFGIIAISSVFIVFFNLLGDMGLGPAIIQFRKLSRSDISSLFGLSFWVGLALSIIFFFAAYLIAGLYGNITLRYICQILSIQIFFTVLNIVPQALLMKERKFNVIAIRSVCIQIFCGALAILAAFKGLGVYSLLISPILSAILNLIVNVYYNRLKISLVPKKEPIKLIASYSTFQLLFNFVNYFGRNLDKLVIGKSLNLSDLGYYEKSYRLMLLPVENISGVISPVLHPFLSEWQNDLNRIFGVFKKFLTLLLTISFPLAAFLFGTAKELILIVFGSQWMPSVPCFMILSLSVALQIPGSMYGAFFQATNKTQLQFKLGMFNVVVGITGLILAVVGWNTLNAICISFDLTSLSAMLVSIVIITKKCFNQSCDYIIKIIYKPFLLCLFLIAFFIIISPFLTHLNLFICLGVKLVSWVIICGLYLRLFTQYRISEIKKALVR